MIEWQSEAGSLIIRIHGKQWYWVYKYDLMNVLSILNTPKNIGHDKWISLSKDGQSANNKYLQTTMLKIRSESQHDYWGEVLSKDFNLVSNFKTINKSTKPNNMENIFLNLSATTLQEPTFFSDAVCAFTTDSTHQGNFNSNWLENLNNIDVNPDMLLNEVLINGCNNIVLKDWSGLSRTVEYYPLSILSQTDAQNNLSFYENNALDDDWEVYSNLRVSELVNPVRFTPTLINQHFYDNQKTSELVFVKFFDVNDAIVEKPEENIDFMVIKQKRYKRKQNINNYWVNLLDHNLEATAVKKVAKQPSTSRFLQNNLIIQQITSLGAKNSFDFYSSIKLNRARSETFSINLSRRLLRTTRTLVLPAYTNISIIANSYDVVHSWFIPGLGLKIDCVPGKSTHHSLYIDNVGLYYGQCAEICGRYHHHMPIRVCALPFEHFLIWWTNKGLPKSTRIRYNSKKVENVLLLKYRW